MLFLNNALMQEEAVLKDLKTVLLSGKYSSRGWQVLSSWSIVK